MYLFILSYYNLPFIFFSLSLFTQQYTRQYLLGKGFHLHIGSPKPAVQKARECPFNLYITNDIKYARLPNHFVGFINNNMYWMPHSHIFFNTSLHSLIVVCLLLNGDANERTIPALPIYTWLSIFAFWKRESWYLSFLSILFAS